MAKYREFWEPLACFGVALSAATFAGVMNQVGPAALATAAGAVVCLTAALVLRRR
jgi:hypothetical protein